MTSDNPDNKGRKPLWLRKKIPSGPDYINLKKIKEHYQLATVCEEARCPNVCECWKKKHATFMILGSRCTRTCLFCSVEKKKPSPPDESEPLRIANAVKELGIRYTVITSVTRDDLEDGGAALFSRTVETIRELNPDVLIELLIPDFKANTESLQKVISSKPDILGHNIETSRRLHQICRRASNYDQSLQVLSLIKKLNPLQVTKSAFMVGLGETDEEIFEMLNDLKKHKVDQICIGQYLQPSKNSMPVARYLEEPDYQKYRKWAEDLGFSSVQAGPFVRSSYRN